MCPPVPMSEGWEKTILVTVKLLKWQLLLRNNLYYVTLCLKNKKKKSCYNQTFYSDHLYQEITCIMWPPVLMSEGREEKILATVKLL